MDEKDYLVKDFMTTQPHFITAAAPVVEARKMMQTHDIRHLPVVQDGEVFGIISDRDVKMAIGLIGASPDTVLVRHVCQEDPYTTGPETPLHAVAQEMAKNRFGSAIIVEEKKLVGIFTTVDACRAIAVITGKKKSGDPVS